MAWLTAHQSKSEVMLISKRTPTPPVCIPPIFIENSTVAGDGERGVGMRRQLKLELPSIKAYFT